MNIPKGATRQFRDAFLQMNLMRKTGLFCDVILITKNIQIPAHRAVLASRSEFFNNCFVQMGQEKHLRLEQIDGKALSTLVNYIYTSHVEIEINLTAIQDLLIGADILQLTNVKDDCYKYLEKHLNLNNSFQILTIAKDQNRMDLLEKAEALVDKNITEIMNTQDFLDLPIDQVTRLISRDTLEVPSEEKVYEGVISWLKHDTTTRIKYLGDLMSLVKLALISPNYIATNIITEPLIQNDLKCKDLIINALLNENIPEMDKPKTRKRTELRQILLVLGGHSNEAKETFEFYDFKTSTWSETYSMPLKIKECNLAFVNQKTYVVSENNVTEYNLESDKWCDSIKMNSSRGCCGVGVLNDCIYAVGGYSNETGPRSVEKFDINHQKWTSIAPMLIGRYWAGVGVLNGLLYSVGGWDTFTSLKSVEYYNPQLNLWQWTSDLITGRMGAAVGILHNKMYVIGGCDGNKYLSSVECYSPGTNRFTQSASLNIPRIYSSVVEFNDKLYVIGGNDGERDLDSIEVYCPKKDRWELLPITMNVARYGHGAVIVNKFTEF